MEDNLEYHDNGDRANSGVPHVEAVYFPQLILWALKWIILISYYEEHLSA